MGKRRYSQVIGHTILMLESHIDNIKYKQIVRQKLNGTTYVDNFAVTLKCPDGTNIAINLLVYVSSGTVKELLLRRREMDNVLSNTYAFKFFKVKTVKNRKVDIKDKERTIHGIMDLVKTLYVFKHDKNIYRRIS